VKTRVSFRISSPIKFTSVEDYSVLGIWLSFDEVKSLEIIDTIIEHDDDAGHDDIVAEARITIAPLIALIEYGHGSSVNIAAVHTHTIEPESSLQIALGYGTSATVTRSVSMPKKEIVANLSDVARRQLEWYSHAESSTSITERIKDYYLILELESRLTAGTPTPYQSPPETIYLRDSVSHAELDNPKVQTYLQQHISATRIDRKNEKHIEFLKNKIPVLQREAQKIVEAKVPRWW